MNQDTFQRAGLKHTRQRDLVLALLKEESYPLTAEAIYQRLFKEGINLSTVYRILKTFADKGVVRKEINKDKENAYSLVKEKDQHVLVCTSCHKRVRIDGCPYHEANEKLEAQTGFLLPDQNTEIYGLCPECRKKLGK